MSPRGRRPGGEDTRQAIVEAAREEFAAKGYDGTSLRGVARAAGVDPRLVHHYFDGKSGLFVEVMHLPVDPSVVVEQMLSAPAEEMGETVVRAFLTFWEQPDAQGSFVGLIRSALTHDEALHMLRGFVVREILGRIAQRVSGDGVDPELAAGLAGSQVVGLAMARYVLEVPGVADASVEELVERVGPTIQRYLTGSH